MDRANPNPNTLDGLPLWRLIVALDDAERLAGAGSATARVLARVLRERLATEHRSQLPEQRGVASVSR